jgi:hypothetical protein
LQELEGARQAFRSFVAAWLEQTRSSGWKLDRKSTMALATLFESDNVYCCSLSDTASIKATISEVAKIDRLPKSDNLECLQVVRCVWDKVDIFTKTAGHCKIIAKTLYIALLAVGVSVTTLTTIHLNQSGCNNSDHLISADLLRKLVLILSLCGSFVASLVALLNPGQRWQQLRGAALSLESEIWKFRTRTGEYSASGGPGLGASSPSASGKQLLSRLEHILVAVSKSASVMETALYSKIDMFGSSKASRSYSHGQYSGSRMTGTFGTSHLSDSHYTPLTPSDYIRFRVEPLVNFYQSRVPTYYRQRVSTELWMVAGVFAVTVLAFTNLTPWSAIPTTITAALTAWKEFHGTEKKLSRYSNTIHKIGSVTLWWSQLTEVEQASLGNANKLVLSCEDQLEREREAWLTTSVATKNLARGAASAARNEHAEQGAATELKGGASIGKSGVQR